MFERAKLILSPIHDIFVFVNSSFKSLYHYGKCFSSSTSTTKLASKIPLFLMKSIVMADVGSRTLCISLQEENFHLDV